MFIQTRRFVYTKYATGGFTLVETILYIALYAIVIGGVILSAYDMFESSAKNTAKAIVQEEGTYLLDKIDWALTGAYAINVTGANKLTISNSDIPKSDDPIVFDIYNSNLRLTRGTNSAEVLNNTNTKISNLVFTHTTQSSNGITLENISTNFTLNSLTSSGLPYQRDFSSIKYLIK